MKKARNDLKIVFDAMMDLFNHRLVIRHFFSLFPFCSVLNG